MPPNTPKIVFMNKGGWIGPLSACVSQVVKMPHVVAFELEAHTYTLAKLLVELLDFGERVGEVVALEPEQELALPAEYPFLIPLRR